MHEEPHPFERQGPLRPDLCHQQQQKHICHPTTCCCCSGTTNLCGTTVAQVPTSRIEELHSSLNLLLRHQLFNSSAYGSWQSEQVARSNALLQRLGRKQAIEEPLEDAVHIRKGYETLDSASSTNKNFASATLPVVVDIHPGAVCSKRPQR